MPVVRELAGRGIRVSVDTMRATTALAAVEAGAVIINDVSAGLADAAMAPIVAETGVHYVAMHWRGHSDRMDGLAEYGDVAAEVRDELSARVEALAAAGVARDRIILDPGLGFAKRGDQNWELLGRLDVLGELGYPILVGASRKRFLGALLPDGAAMEERDLPTAVVSALSAQAGAWVCACTTCAARGARSTSSERGRVDDVARTPDRITLTGVRVRAHHGVFEFEREQGQEFVIDVSVASTSPPRHPATTSPAPCTTASSPRRWSRRCAAIPSTSSRPSPSASPASRSRTPRVEEVEVTVHKPEAPISVPFADVAVTIVRSRA